MQRSFLFPDALAASVPPWLAEWDAQARLAGFPPTLSRTASQPRVAAAHYAEHGGVLMLVYARPLVEMDSVGLAAVRTAVLLCDGDHLLVGGDGVTPVLFGAKEVLPVGGGYALAVQHLRDEAQGFIDLLRQIQAQLAVVEQQLERAVVNRHLFQLLADSKRLIWLQAALESNAMVLQRFAAAPALQAHPQAARVLADAVMMTRQASALAQIQARNLGNLMDAYAAAVENNLSLLVQSLSVYIVIAAIPLGLAGLYGMNLPLPGQTWAWTLLALLGCCALIVATLIARFRARQMI